LASTPSTGAGVNWADGIAGNDTWNGTVDATSGNLNGLLDSTGAVTNVNVTWSGFNFTYNSYNNGRSGNGVTNGPNGDGFFTNSGTGDVTISGLTDGAIYNLTVMGAGDEFDVTVNGSTQIISAWDSATNAEHFAVFNNITATGGSITYTIDGAANEGTGGFQINVVPEPSSVSLLGLAALSLMIRRKR